MICYAYKTLTTSCGLLVAETTTGEARQTTCARCLAALGIVRFDRSTVEIEPSASWDQWGEDGHALPMTPPTVIREVASPPCDA